MNTLTLTADEVDLIVRAVVPATSTDEFLPVFTSIQITASDGALWATGTDRYKMCRARLRDFTDTLEEVLIPAAWFKTATKMLRLHFKGEPSHNKNLPPKADKCDLEATVAWDDLSVTFRAVGVPTGRTMGTQPIALEFRRDGGRGAFPKIAHMLKLPPRSDVEFAVSSTTMPPAELVRYLGYGGEGGGVFVPPSKDRKTFAVVDPAGRWTWVGMPLRLSRPEPKVATSPEQASA